MVWAVQGFRWDVRYSCSDLAAKGLGLPDACLAEAAPHFAHDAELLDMAWAEREKRIAWTLWFVLARSQWDFFFRFERKKGADDILAVDYPATTSWRAFAEKLLETADDIPDLKAMRQVANKNAAHLTYSRLDATADGGAPSETVHRFLLGVRASWLESLTPEVRVWFGR